MTENTATFERRSAWIQAYLETMYHRSHEIAHGFCFMVFETNPPEEDGSLTKKAARRPARSLVSVGGDAFTPDEAAFLDALDAEIEEENPFRRYVQFGFEEHRFLMDLPLGTLFVDEAKEITARRNGFSWARNNAKSATSKQDIEDFDPLQKFYRYGDEKTAAEDAAFIFFEVWGFPVDSPLYVSAASGGTNHSWERGEPCG